MKRSMMLLAASLLAMACDKPAEQKQDDPASKNATTTSAQPTQTAATPPPVTIADSDLSTPADFEEAAEKSITKASYKTELASLETELGKE
jgi:hypothetical protein